MKVLVTGASGFIGSHLITHLKREGFETVGLDRKVSNKETIQGDCLNRTSLKEVMKEGVDWLVHLAANPDTRSNASDLFRDNVLATNNVIEMAEEFRVPDVTFASSSTVYGEGRMPAIEDQATQPISFYGWSKLFCEELLKQHSGPKMKITVLRYANVIGPQGHGVVPDLIAKLRRNPNELEVFGDGTQSKSYVYVEDAISGMIAAHKANGVGYEVFNIGTEDEITVEEIVREVCGKMRLAPKVIWKPAESGRGWKGDVRFMRLSITKLKESGWRPKLNSLGAVRATIESLL
jgi:UDP-glucose 4-epimerase